MPCGSGGVTQCCHNVFGGGGGAFDRAVTAPLTITFTPCLRDGTWWLLVGAPFVGNQDTGWGRTRVSFARGLMLMIGLHSVSLFSHSECLVVFHPPTTPLPPNSYSGFTTSPLARYALGSLSSVQAPSSVFRQRVHLFLKPPASSLLSNSLTCIHLAPSFT